MLCMSSDAKFVGAMMKPEKLWTQEGIAVAKPVGFESG